MIINNRDKRINQPLRIEIKNPNLWFEKSESPVNLIERERLEERGGRGREKIAEGRERESRRNV